MREIGVQQVVQVDLNEEAFTEDFMAEFCTNFYNFKSLEQHAEHIAQLTARGIVDTLSFESQFVEGYGPLGEFVKRLRISDCETTVLDM